MAFFLQDNVTFVTRYFNLRRNDSHFVPPCPRCGNAPTLSFKVFAFDEGRGFMTCACCGFKIKTPFDDDLLDCYNSLVKRWTNLRRG